MNERQRDLFLYIWSRRRAPGQAAVAMRGAIIGALAGLVFSAVLAGDIDPAQLAARGGTLLLASVAVFAGIGFFLSNRVFASQEAMYQNMLAQGARVPAEKPVMQGADRWPGIAVGITAAVIAGFIAFVWITLG
ncbi:MAG: hypothetical protein R3C27_13330 [Hyphomonadaceae bacterium]